MADKRLLDRREFTVDAVLAALSGVAISISACGGGGGGTDYASPSAPSAAPPTAASASGDEEGSVSNNHGHSAVVTGAQLLAGNAVQLDIRGSADHTHAVTLSVEAVQAIKQGRAVQADSTTTTAHVHTVVFNGDTGESPSGY